MASGLNFRIAASLDAAGFKDASARVQDLGKQTKELKTETLESQGAVDLLKNAYTALLGAGIIEFYKEAIDEASQAREQETLLAGRVDQTGMSYEKAKPKLDAFFESLQAQTGIAQDKLIPAFNILVDKTNSVRDSQLLMQTTLGVSRGRGLQLADAADLVAGAFERQPKALGQVARMLGMTSEEAKNADAVIKRLREKFDGLATSTDEAEKSMASLKNTIKDTKQLIGEGILEPFGQAAKAVALFVAMLVTLVQMGGVLLGQLVHNAEASMERFINIFKIGPKRAALAYEASVKDMQKSTDEALDVLGKKLERLFHPPADTGQNLVDAMPKRYAEMTLEMKKIVAEGNLAMADSDAQRVNRRVELINLESQQMMEALRQQEDFARLSAENQAALTLAIERQRVGELKKLYAQDLQNRTQVAFMASVQIGQATAKMMRGEKDAWKDASRAIIDAIVQQSIAVVQARAIQAAAGRLAVSAGADYAGAAAAIGWGLVQSAAIAGIGEAAKGALGGSDSGSAAGGGASAGGGFSSGGTGGAVAPAAAPQRQQITINVQGDVVDSDRFLDGLASRLSERVENADVRLVASGTR